jgi:Na+-driven multidrug efflux pump
MRWAHHSKVSENEENMRVPIRMATLTKKAIRNAIPVLDVQSELNLFNIVDNFMVAYFG